MATIQEALVLAVQHHQGNRLAEAEAIYRQILRVQPGNPDARHLLGVVARRTGREAEAVALMTSAIALQPALAEAHGNLGNLLSDQGRAAEAVACYRCVVALKPRDTAALFTLGRQQQILGRTAEAEATYRAVLAIDPNHDDAIYNRGVAVQHLGRFDEAAGIYRRIIAAKPDHANALNNLSAVLRFQERLEESVAAARRAIAVEPDHAEAHKNLGFSLLLLGRYDEGFPHYEWRWRTSAFAPWRLPLPEWTGEPMPGRTILIMWEQGLGDTIQFIRYAAMVKAMGMRVVVVCQESLGRLLKGVAGIDALVPEGRSRPAADVWAPLLSLPRLLGTRVETVPAAVPYLAAEPALAESWRERLGARRALRVGLIWAGNPSFGIDRDRSPRLDWFQPLLETPGVAFYGLQMGDGRRDLEGRTLPPSFTDLGSGITDFADTAAIMANLDLVISSCTATAHLAGALGRPVWIALPRVPDWRWLTGREDSPWYPTARLFRQERAGDWAGVFARIGAALQRQAAVGLAASEVTDGHS